MTQMIQICAYQKMLVEDLNTMGYRRAWERQERAHEEVVLGAEERLFLVEHRPVITFGRRAGAASQVHVLLSRG